MASSKTHWVEVRGFTRASNRDNWHEKQDHPTKLIWLALRNITEDWGRAANHWKSAMNQFAILYGDRFTQPTHGGAK